MTDISFAEIRALAYALSHELGREIAVNAIRTVGEAEHLVGIRENRFAAFKEHAEFLLDRHRRPVSELHRVAVRLGDYLITLEEARQLMTQAYDNLKAAIEGAATEMGTAADFIRNHPNTAVNNDPEMQALADRLTAASAALGAVDVDTVVSSTDTAGTGGTVSNGGTVSG